MYPPTASDPHQSPRPAGPPEQPAWPPGPPQPSPAPVGEPQQRPSLVTVAGVALLGQAVMGLAAAGVAFLAYTRVGDNADAAAAADQLTDIQADSSDFAAAMCLGMIAYSVVAALVIAPPAVGVLRGSRVGRVLAWVAGGLMLLVGCCAYPLLMINGTGNNGPQCAGGACGSASYRDIIGTEVMVAMSALTVIQWLLIVAAGIMLALPPAHRYFQARSIGQPS